MVSKYCNISKRPGRSSIHAPSPLYYSGGVGGGGALCLYVRGLKEPLWTAIRISITLYTSNFILVLVTISRWLDRVFQGQYLPWSLSINYFAINKDFKNLRPQLIKLINLASSVIIKIVHWRMTDDIYWMFSGSKQTVDVAPRFMKAPFKKH